MLDPSPGCRLPCLLDAIPGTSPWNKVSEHARDLKGVDFYFSGPIRPERAQSLPMLNDLRQYQVGLAFSGTGIIDIVYVVTANELVETLVRLDGAGLSEAVERFSLRRVIATYGQPSDIWIRTETYSNGPRALYVVLFYGNQGFYVDHLLFAPKQTSKDGKLVICGAKSDAVRLLMWDPRSRSDTFERFRATIIVNDRLSYEHLSEGAISHSRYLPIEAATGMSADMFSMLILHDDSDCCLETPGSLWEN